MTHADLRTKRTKIFIQNALVELTHRRGFEEISVEDISKKAMINRATFYRYYKNKYLLVEDLYRDALQKLADDTGPPKALRGILVRGAPRKPDDERFQVAWTRLFDHFASNSRLYAAMLGDRGSAWFQTRMREHMAKFLRRWHLAQPKPAERKAESIPVDIAQAFLSNALIGIVSCWLKGGMRYSSARVAKWFRRMAREGYVRTIGHI